MENLKKLRKNLKLTQEEVAKICNVSLRSYQNYENGLREMNYTTLLNAANYFNCSIDYLLGHQTQGILHLDGLSQIKKDLIDKITKVSDRLAERTESYLNGLLVAENDKEDLINKLRKGE